MRAVPCAAMRVSSAGVEAHAVLKRVDAGLDSRNASFGVLRMNRHPSASIVYGRHDRTQHLGR